MTIHKLILCREGDGFFAFKNGNAAICFEWANHIGLSDEVIEIEVSAEEKPGFLKIESGDVDNGFLLWINGLPVGDHYSTNFRRALDQFGFPETDGVLTFWARFPRMDFFLDPTNFDVNLAHMNDRGVSFKEIADVIERTL